MFKLFTLVDIIQSMYTATLGLWTELSENGDIWTNKMHW